VADLTTLDSGSRVGALQAAQAATGPSRLVGIGTAGGTRLTPEDQAASSALSRRLAEEQDAIEFSLRLDALVDQFGGFQIQRDVTEQLADIADQATRAGDFDRAQLAEAFNRILDSFDDLGTDASIAPAQNDFATPADAASSGDEVQEAQGRLNEEERLQADAASVDTLAQLDQARTEDREAEALALQLQLQLEESGLSLSLDTLRAFPFTPAELERR